MVNAGAMIPERRGTPRGAAFWCEQAIEKYFKHIIVQDGRHDDLSLRHKLLPLATAAGYSFSAETRVILRELGQMYYERYPVSEGEELPEDPTWEEIEMIYKLALSVRDWTHSVVRKRNQIVKGGVHKMQLF